MLFGHTLWKGLRFINAIIFLTKLVSKMCGCCVLVFVHLAILSLPVHLFVYIFIFILRYTYSHIFTLAPLYTFMCPLSSQSVDFRLLQTLSVCVSVCLYRLYLTMGRIFIKLGENIGTSVRSIVLKFHCATPLGLCATREARNRSKG